MKYLKRIMQSIALVPSLLALCFLIFAVILLICQINFKATPWIGKICFTNKEDVQSVLAFIIGGIFTLTVFSYTMVMNVLNRNINNYSPRLIPMILGEKHHQLILGVTSGTIIYAMTLSIALNAEGITYFPGIAAPLGIVFGITCVILFIYFIHSVSRSIHINHIIKEAYVESQKLLTILINRKKMLFEIDEPDFTKYTSVASISAGYLKMPDLDLIVRFCAKNKVSIKLLKKPGEFILRGEDLLLVEKMNSKITAVKVLEMFPVDYKVPMKVLETGFKHLVEIAIKAMSPAINDPGTAITCLDYLTQLYMERDKITQFNAYKADDLHYFFFSIVPISTLYKYSFIELHNYFKIDPVLMEYMKRSMKIITENTDVIPISSSKLSSANSI